jgi:NAD dependent epimerase/dehydratase family enzyme
MFAGGPIGRGDQWVSWIHLDDLVSMMIRALEDDAWRGAFNGVAPEPVTNAELARALGEVLRRPSFVRTPAFALRAIFGEGAEAILAGQRVVPQRATALGFVHRFPELVSTLEELLR